MIAHVARVASTPVLSEVLTLISLLVLSLGVLLVLRYFLPLRSTPAFYGIPIFFALWLPAGIILLVPIDLASSATAADEASRGIWLPANVRLASWKVTYWLTFALTWFILPVLGEYADSGYREPRDKLIAALRANAQYHAMVFGAGLVGLVYVFASYGVSPTALKGIVVALAYCWGLALAIYLMGHGLVSIPRRFLRNASIAGRLRRVQSRAPRVHEQMEDAILHLEDVEAQVAELSRRKVGSARDFRDWIEELAEMANLPEAQAGARPPAARGADVESRVLPTVVTQKYLANLTTQLVRARHERSRYVSEWSQVVEEAARMQTLLDSAPSRRLGFRPAANGGFWDRVAVLTPRTRFLFYYHVVPAARVALGGILATASVLIVWSELVKAVLPGLSVIRLSVVHHWDGDRPEVGFAGQVISALWISYMCVAALGSVTEVKVWRGRALVHRNTSHESAFWYASQVARLSIPLSYNFMTFMSPRVYTGTAFYDFVGKLVNLTALGSLFDRLFPVFILVPVCAALFGLYGRVGRFLGFGVVDVIDDDEGEGLVGFGTGSWREGRDLIERELGGNSTVRSREEAFARLAAASGRGRAAPILSVPPPPGNGSPLTMSPIRPQPGPSAASIRLPTPPAGVGDADDAEDENFFAVLGHRMMNTIDSIEAPQWWQDMKPAWMGGDSSPNGRAVRIGGGSGSSSARPPADRGNSEIRRWFGGGSGSDEGRIRL